MNKESVIKHMIKYIEEAERDLQAVTLANEAKGVKADVVNKIIRELEREMPNED